jgi:UPF0716 protein FxsA
MLKYVLVGLLALPFVDMYVLFEAANAIGFLEVLGIVAATGIIGAWAVKREGVQVLLRLQSSVTAGEASGNMIEAVLVTLGGLALITPGFLTDITGVLMVGRPTRQRIMLRVRQKFQDNIRFQFQSV